MADLTLRNVKGSPLTNQEVDDNFSNLNTDKVEKSGDTLTGDLAFGDNVKAKFGASDDLQIYHDGLNSYIDDVGTGDLIIRASDDLRLQKYTGETMLNCKVNASVDLYYDNAKKLATTSSGVDVTGTLVSDGLDVDNLKILSGQSTTLTNEVSPLIYRAAGHSDYNNGDLLIQARSSASRNIYMLTGTTTPVNRLQVNGTGDISFYSDNGSNQDFYWDASTSRLGLGTTTPSTTLDVNGIVTANGLITDPTNGVKINTGSSVEASWTHDAVTGTSTLNVGRNSTWGGELIIQTDTKNRALFASNGDISFYDDSGTSQDFYWDASTSRLGLGTSSPSGKLHLAGPHANQIFRIDESTSGYTYTQGLDNTGVYFSSNSLFRGFRWSNGGSERMRIDSSGRLGIGTTAPAGKLDVLVGSDERLIFSTLGTDPLISAVNAANSAYTSLQLGGSDVRFFEGGSEAARIDSSGRLGINTTTPATELDVNGTVTQDANLLRAIDSSIADTAVDVFVYDTRKDSDGGAWRHRTQHTSWYNETLNTSTRGSRKEFPAVAVIVAESNQVTIYDGDDPELPMWMVFNATSFNVMMGGSSGINSVTALNGKMCRGSTPTGTYDLVCIDFIGDRAARAGTSTIYGPYNGTIKQRNQDASWTSGITSFLSSGPIINRAVNDVAMTVLPNAPIDYATGLPIPTIAVATDGGVSVIKDDGTVVDSADTVTFRQVMFDGVSLLFNRDLTSTWLRIVDDISVATDGFAHDHNVGRFLEGTSDYPALGYSNQENPFAALGDKVYAVGNYEDAKGLFHYQKGSRIGSGRGTGMVAYTTSTYNTGWMNGDIRLATLSDTDDTDVTGSELVTNGDFATGDLTGWTDKSSGVGTATVNGSNQLELYRTDLGNVGWVQQAITTVSGARYLLTVNEITDGGAIFIGSTDGGSDIYGVAASSGVNIVMFTATSTTTYIGLRGSGNGTTSVYDDVSVRLAEEDRSVNGNGLQVYGTITKDPVATGADLVAYSGFSASNYLEQPYNSDLDFGTGDFCVMGWMIMPATRGEAFGRSDGDLSWLLESRGDLATTSINFRIFDVGSYSDVLPSVSFPTNKWEQMCVVRRSGVIETYVGGRLGSSVANVRNLDRAGSVFQVGKSVARNLSGGSLALLRISATAPTADQIKKIYEDEKVLFQENAQATLYGSSDAVSALAHDDDTNLLHVGTSAGRSVFQGLRRVDNTTTAVGTAISASNGMVVEE